MRTVKRGKGDVRERKMLHKKSFLEMNPTPTLPYKLEWLTIKDQKPSFVPIDDTGKDSSTIYNEAGSDNQPQTNLSSIKKADGKGHVESTSPIPTYILWRV